MNKKTYFLGLAILVFMAALSMTSSVNASRTGTQSVGGYFTTNSDALNTVYYNTGPVNIGSSASGIATLFVQGYSGSATSTFSVASSTGQKTFDISSTGTTTIKQYQGFGVPTVATSSGIGTTGTATFATGSTDLAGALFVTTGAAPAASATIFTFTSASSTLPFCQFSALNTAAANVATSTSIATTTNGFALNIGVTTLTASTAYKWVYLCN